MRRLLVLGCVAMVGCGGGGGGGTTTEPPGPGGTQPPGAQAPLTAQVEMRSDDDGYGSVVPSFQPRRVQVRAGGSVTWSNGTGVAHNVTFSGAGAPPNIPDHASGANSRTFPTAGSFDYQCTLHPTMTGTVDVAS